MTTETKNDDTCGACAAHDHQEPETQEEEEEENESEYEDEGSDNDSIASGQQHIQSTVVTHAFHFLGCPLWRMERTETRTNERDHALVHYEVTESAAADDDDEDGDN